MKRAIAWALALATSVVAGNAIAGENAGETYTVRRGQTLTMISDDVLGDPQLWPAIYRANRDQIKDPKVLHVGQKLEIPAVPADPAVRNRIREEAVAWVAPPQKPAGPDVAAAPPKPGETASSTTE